MLALKQCCSFRRANTPGEKVQKLVNLLLGPDRLERINLLLKIRWNKLFFNHKPSDTATVTFEEFVAQLKLNDPPVHELIRPDGESELTVQEVRAKFSGLIAKNGQLPFPEFYNADRSLALISYALARHLKPVFAVETGVGYGMTSALVLLALERNNSGQLVSIDLPSLSDPSGTSTGLVVSEDLKKRWTLHIGGSGRWLPGVVSDRDEIGLFISDSANVYTLQRYEFETVYPKLTAGGAAVFNNVGSTFQGYLRSVDGIKSWSIWQVDKPSCATAVVIKK